MDDVEVEVELGSVQVEGCQSVLVCFGWGWLSSLGEGGKVSGWQQRPAMWGRLARLVDALETVS